MIHLKAKATVSCQKNVGYNLIIVEKAISAKLDTALSLDVSKRDGRYSMAWSLSSKYLAVKLEKYPKHMFLIELHSLELHTVVSFQKTDEVRSISWSRNDDLFFSWGSPALGVWTEESIGAVNPAYAKPFKISTIQASQDNSIIMLKGGKSICLYYPDLFSRNKNIPDFIGKSIIASQRVSQVSASFYKGDRSQNDSINLRRVEVDTTRKSHEIPTKDLMDMYDRKKTPEKGGNDREYDSNETFGRRDDDYEYQRKHKFEY